MKRFLILPLFLLPFLHSIAQNPNKEFDLVNGLPQLVSTGNIDQAVKNTVELSALRPALLDFPVNKVLGPALIAGNRQDDQTRANNSIRYFRGLWDAKNPVINAMIWPLVSWLDISQASSKKDKISQLKDYLAQLPADTLDWKLADLYSFLILKDLDNSKLDNIQAYKDLFGRLQSHLLVRQQKNPKDERTNYFLSYSWYYLSQKNPKQIDSFLSKAADASPGMGASDYFYEMIMLDNALQRNGFRQDYYDYLMGVGKESEALTVMQSIAYQEPIDSQMAKLEQLFLKIHPDGKSDFPQYWYETVSSHCESLPATSFKNDKGEEVILWTKTGKWTYIDVWGTWCSPCVAEIPDLQVLYTKNSQTANSKLSIVTWGYDSQAKMDAYMKEKAYTFPVILITKELAKTFNITGYPTKILITPEGKFLKIPFGVEWKEYLRNYTRI